MRELIPWFALIMQRRSRLLIGGLLIFLTVLSGLGLLALSGWFISATAVTGLLLTAGLPAALDIYIPGSGIRFFAVSRTVGRYTERVYNHDTILRLLADTRIRLFQGLTRKSQSEQTGQTGAQWLTRLTSDLDALDTLYIRLLAPSIVALIVSGLLIALASWVLPSRYVAILATCLILALLVVTFGLYYRTRKLAGERVISEERIRVAVVEYIEGNAELTAAGMREAPRARLQNITQAYSLQQAVVDERTGWHQAVSTIFTNGAAVAALVGGLLMVESDIISGPVSIVFPLLLLGFGEVYSSLPDAFGQLGGTIAAATRLNRDCAEPEAVDTPAPNTPRRGTDPTSARVILTEVSVRYEEACSALAPVSLEVNAGDHIGIVGGSGSGKSTLANIIAGLFNPQAGDVERYTPSDDIAYLTQRTVLFNDTLRNNLVLDGRVLDDQQLWRMLALVGLTERVSTMPQGLDTWLGAYGRSLSGGEARRVVLARTLLTDANLLILDEPFTGVDHPTRASISSALESDLADKTVIMFGHDTEALLQADRVIHLK